MPLRFNGNYTAFVFYYQQFRNGSASEAELTIGFIRQTRIELDNLVKFVAGIIKGVGFPIGLLLQILTIIFLLRGNSGYSRSARNWFLLVVGADIASTVYRVYELVTEDFSMANPDSNIQPGVQLMLAMWGLRQPDHVLLQRVMCKVFFIILYFPIFLSPIALTASSLIRCYCVKFPLQAKFAITKCFDRSIMLFSSMLALAIAIVIGALLVDGWSYYAAKTTVMGMVLGYGECSLPTYDVASANKGLQFIGSVFMLVVIFLICAFNFVSAIIIIMVLFESRKNRMMMSSSEGTDARSEVRATVMLLGMNVALFICFFFSRLLIVISTRIDYYVNPFLYVMFDRIGTYLFAIPYYTNSLFIAGFSRKFYSFLFPCITEHKIKKASSSDSQRTF